MGNAKAVDFFKKPVDRNFDKKKFEWKVLHQKPYVVLTIDFYKIEPIELIFR